MIKILQNSSFIKNSVILVAGAGLSQAIPMLFSPVLARIFSPEQFGVFSVFLAASTVLAILATGLYELAIVKAKRLRDAFHLVVLVQWIAVFVCSLLLAFIIIYEQFFHPTIDLSINGVGLYLLPVSVFTIALFNGLNYWLNRNRAYTKISLVKLLQSLGVTLLSIAIGLLGFKENGLILGLVFGNFMTILPLLIYLFNKRSEINKQELRKAAMENSSFPKVVLPSTLMNTVASYCPVFFITYYFSAEIVGNFTMTTRILTAPVAIISVAVGQIYYKRVADMVNFYKEPLSVDLLRTSKLLALISLVLFIPLYFFGNDLLVLVLGQQWQAAGTYLQILVFGVMLRFIVSPLSTALLATQYVKFLSLWQGLYFLSILVVFYFTRHLEILSVLKIYVLNEVLMYSFYYLLICTAVWAFDKKKINDTIV
ncbi:MAG: oligosaccharide flippase family protein [Leadbetterella sp.]|nr:oligosaccharide flippase family protein [Leadbetterella sp.]